MPLSTHLGHADETSYGTPVTVTRFTPLLSESINAEVIRTRTSALRTGKRTSRTDEVVVGVGGYAGSVELPVESKGFGIWLKRMLGAVTTTGPTNSAYTHTATISLGPPQSFTMQINRPFAPAGTTNQPFTFEGCQISSWELTCSVDDILKFSAELVCENGTTATALATPSFPASTEPLSWARGQVTIASTPVPVTEWKISCDNKLKTDRRYLANSTLRAQAPRTDYPEITAEFTCDFSSLTDWNRLVASSVSGTIAAVELRAEAATAISGTVYPAVVVNLSAAQFDEVNVNVSDGDMLMQTIKVTALDNGSAEPITVAYISTDVTP